MSDKPIKPENLASAIGMLKYYVDHAEELPDLDRERKIASEFLQVMYGEETLKSLADKAVKENEEQERKHPISTWFYNIFHHEG